MKHILIPIQTNFNIPYVVYGERNSLEWNNNSRLLKFFVESWHPIATVQLSKSSLLETMKLRYLSCRLVRKKSNKMGEYLGLQIVYKQLLYISSFLHQKHSKHNSRRLFI